MKYFICGIVCLSVIFLTACSHNKKESLSVETPIVEILRETPPLAIDNKKIEAESAILGEDSPWSFQSFIDKEVSGTDFTVGKAFATYQTHTSYYVSYLSDGLKVSGTLHVPNGTGPFPLVVLNHGYFPPETYTNGYGFGREQKYLARNGYVALHIDYRGYAYSDRDNSPFERQRPGYLGYGADALNAIAAITSANLPYINNEKIGMLGHSMGGAVTLNAITARPDMVQAAVIWGACSGDYQKNFDQWARERFTDKETEIFTTHFGDIDDPASFVYASASQYFDRIETPISIHHGIADEIVPLFWSEETQALLQQLGKETEYFEYENAKHVFWNEYWNTAMENSRVFLDKHLK